MNPARHPAVVSTAFAGIAAIELMTVALSLSSHGDEARAAQAIGAAATLSLIAAWSVRIRCGLALPARPCGRLPEWIFGSVAAFTMTAVSATAALALALGIAVPDGPGVAARLIPTTALAAFVIAGPALARLWLTRRRRDGF